jgi:hypothetical protein
VGKLIQPSHSENRLRAVFSQQVPLPITVIIGMEFQVTKAAGSNLRWTFFNNNKGVTMWQEEDYNDVMKKAAAASAAYAQAACHDWLSEPRRAAAADRS